MQRAWKPATGGMVAFSIWTGFVAGVIAYSCSANRTCSEQGLRRHINWMARKSMCADGTHCGLRTFDRDRRGIRERVEHSTELELDASEW